MEHKENEKYNKQNAPYNFNYRMTKKIIAQLTRLKKLIT